MLFVVQVVLVLTLQATLNNIYTQTTQNISTFTQTIIKPFYCAKFVIAPVKSLHLVREMPECIIHVSPSINPGPNLDHLCVWQSDTAPVYENYAKLYFDAKHLDKGLNRGW